MSKPIVFLLLFCLLLFAVSSCDNETSNDKEPPVIEVLTQTNELYLDSSFAAKDSAVGNNRNLNLIIVRLSDNEALSSYIVKLKPGTGFLNPNDTLYANGGGRDTLAFSGIIATPRANIFGLKEITFRSQLIPISSSFSKFNPKTNKTETYQIRPGKYFLIIECVDIAGNNAVYTSKEEVTVSYPL